MAVRTTNEVVYAEPMPAGTLAPKVELIALTKLLCWDRERRLMFTQTATTAPPLPTNIGPYTKKAGLLTSEGKDNYKEKLNFIPSEGIVRYPKISQNTLLWPTEGDNIMQKRNRLAD